MKGMATIITLSGGTPHKPNPVDSNGFPILEATAAAKALIAMDINPSAILEEAFSLDTIGNAYFLRTVHIHPGRFTKMYVITNTWHMERTQAMFNTVFHLPDHKFNILTLLTSLFSSCLHIQYISVSPGLSSSALESRVLREKSSLRSFLTHTVHQFSSMSELHDWLFTQHTAYASSRLLSTRPPIDPEVLKSY
eukprot:CAMPEP_0182435154 /NCGR_PEP_ID=MMETSP1167-20130531/74045_1 /TAXON_ID=2988 /ORGANISM="Mallomonas Sp, Strain CCMP3275" /LENGTH=193 /DNA_ID=CAMNT_0024625877 /DNA_START=253 /DNA_END=834 /DNA_ORIENTATION=-